MPSIQEIANPEDYTRRVEQLEEKRLRPYEELYDAIGMENGYDFINKIPLEIRLKIWRHLLPRHKVIKLYGVDRRSKDGSIDDSYDDSDEPKAKHWTDWDTVNTDVCEGPNFDEDFDISLGNEHYEPPVLLHICSETRQFALRHLKLLPVPLYRTPRPVYFNYTKDTVRMMWYYGMSSHLEDQLKMIKRFEEQALRSRARGLRYLAMDICVCNHEPMDQWRTLVQAALKIRTLKALWLIGHPLDYANPRLMLETFELLEIFEDMRENLLVVEEDINHRVSLTFFDQLHDVDIKIPSHRCNDVWEDPWMFASWDDIHSSDDDRVREVEDDDDEDEDDDDAEEEKDDDEDVAEEKDDDEYAADKEDDDDATAEE